jgi:CBS domain-containing protein
MSIPICIIPSNDNVWVAASMLSRISDITNCLVVVEDEFPVGTIGAFEILDGLHKNPTSKYFDESVTKIMNADFYIDSRNTDVASILRKMNRTREPFVIIDNEGVGFSQFSIRQTLEIGSLCKTDFRASSFPKKHISTFKRDDKIIDVVKKLEQARDRVVFLNDQVSFVNHGVLLEKIKELNTTPIDNLLDISASTLKTVTPTLVSDRLSLSEICKIMLGTRYPCVMTSDQVITPYDVLGLFCKGI